MTRKKVPSEEQEQAFIEGELKFMGPGDPNGKPGTWRSQNGE